jgi:hypothetical protein
MSVYIITRNRPGNLKKIVPRWLEQRMHVMLVVEQEEYDNHLSLIRGMYWHNVDVLAVSGNRGVGRARQAAVEHASAVGIRTMIMSDDDLRPASESLMSLLLTEARRPGVLGIGATRGIHDRFSNGITTERDDVILCPGGWGMQLFGLNVPMTVKLGNFDPLLDCWGEDHELMRNGIAEGIPWLVHCGVRCEPIGKRYDPGGLNAYVAEDDRPAREMVCKKLIHERWPLYTSAPDKKSRMQWQKMMNDCIPNWRAKSAIHGGEWR